MKVCIVRYGAYGDAVIMSMLPRLFKEKGYEVTCEVSPRTKEVLRNNPYIDHFIDHDESIPADDRLTRYWEDLSGGYDKFINLCESIERGMLAVEGDKEFYLPKDERHGKYNKNYYDYTLELAGLNERGLNGELYFSEDEIKLARVFRKRHKGKFLILWALSGSAFHKAYPYAEYVADAFFSKKKDVVIVTVGDQVDRIIEFLSLKSKNIIRACGKWSFRRAMLMAKYADLVIGEETGILNASGCFDTPKIVILSHSSEENLTKYWKNCISLSAEVSCQPCHRLIYTQKPCPKDDIGGALIPICCSRLNAKDVLDSMNNVYERWGNGVFHRI